MWVNQAAQNYHITGAFFPNVNTVMWSESKPLVGSSWRLLTLNFAHLSPIPFCAHVSRSNSTEKASILSLPLWMDAWKLERPCHICSSEATTNNHGEGMHFVHNTLSTEVNIVTFDTQKLLVEAKAVLQMNKLMIYGSLHGPGQLCGQSIIYYWWIHGL